MKLERLKHADRWICISAEFKRWYKRQGSKLRRRMERDGLEPRRLRDLIKGWRA